MHSKGIGGGADGSPSKEQDRQYLERYKGAMTVLTYGLRTLSINERALICDRLAPVKIAQIGSHNGLVVEKIDDIGI